MIFEVQVPPKGVLRYVYVGAMTCTIALASTGRADAPPGRYTLGTGTVFDTKTKLTWQRAASSTPYSQSDARNSCPSGWRLPTLNELASLIDLSRSNPAIDVSAFPSTPAQPFWSTTYAFGGASVFGFVVDFNTGAVYQADSSELHYTRCVK